MSKTQIKNYSIVPVDCRYFKCSGGYQYLFARSFFYAGYQFNNKSGAFTPADYSTT